MKKITKYSLGMSSFIIVGFLIFYFFVPDSMLSFLGFMFLAPYSILGMVVSGIGISREAVNKYKALNITSFIVFLAFFIFPLYVYIQLNS